MPFLTNHIFASEILKPALDLYDEIVEKLARFFSKKVNVLIFGDAVIIYIYLRNSQPKFLSLKAFDNFKNK